MKLPKTINKPIKVLYQLDEYDLRIDKFYTGGTVRSTESETWCIRKHKELIFKWFKKNTKWYRNDAISSFTYEQAKERLEARIERNKHRGAKILAIE